MHFVEQKHKLEKGKSHSFREMNFLHQSIEESQIKNKTLSYSLRQKKGHFFVPFILSEVNFFKICIAFYLNV